MRIQKCINNNYFKILQICTKLSTSTKNKYIFAVNAGSLSFITLETV
jgi:hypothetical protein